ncbi:MAG: 16S rRNA (guanine(966)-N(2))-methyltransferase RsmD [Beijerinckiaceae bacterium]|nr:16S rRNA (guanine(966)-N(2))-methyltransferase RsmD [Beijerinckiaceae bacterium]
MRIVGGRYKGKTLAGPKTDAIRPTSDRLRETLFNILAHRPERGVEGARVLDLFAGTGALALEALSRGAIYACLVDEGAEARGLIRANIDALGAGGVTRVLRRDATKLGPVSPFEPFDLVFLDPPYGKRLGERAVASAIGGGWLAQEAVIVWEERASVPLSPPSELIVLDRREAGEAQVLIAAYRAR